jgi:phosphatidate phosphatase PAH1
MKYIVDIDGTICDKPTDRSDGDYESSIPKLDRIAKINKLYDEGHHITYFTARGMGRYCDNADLAKARFYDITELQLRLWGCKYHKLILGKPSADFYIDDKGINANEFFGD